MFDPESKVKFMLEGLANIILRPNMSGLLTEYQKMKIAKYEIPLSSCSSMLEDTLYSRHVKKDNGEEQEKLEIYMAETARKFDEEKAARLKNQLPKKKPKTFPPTRRQKIERMREEYGVQKFSEAIVDTDNVFKIGNDYYRIPESCQAYAPKKTKDGDVLYDMDKIICGETISGDKVFFDMNIEPVTDIVCMGEQMRFA